MREPGLVEFCEVLLVVECSEPKNFTVLEREMVFPSSLMGHIQYCLFSVPGEHEGFCLSVLLLIPLVSHHFSNSIL